MAETSAPSCYVCGSAQIADDADLRSPTCTEHRAARDHIVSNRRCGATGDALAVCPCGWTAQRPWGGHHVIMDELIKAHWRAVSWRTA